MTIQPSSADTENLLPCPVCQVDGAQIFHDSSGLCIASCENDDCRFTVQIYGVSAEDAAKNWNTRDVVAAPQPQPVLHANQAAMDDQRDPDATRALRMEQFEEEHRKSLDTSVAWPPLKKALWNVLMTENLNDGHYIRAFDLIEKLYSAALASSSPKHRCQNWAGDCSAYISTGIVCDACRLASIPVLQRKVESQTLSKGSNKSHEYGDITPPKFWRSLFAILFNRAC